MKNIYLPVDNVSDFACYSIRSSEYIRAYKNMPQINSSSDYVDFYINSHYLEFEGTQTWGSYISNLPTCISELSITNNPIYRNDFDSILIIFSFFLVFCFYFPTKLVFKLFKKGRV